MSGGFITHSPFRNRTSGIFSSSYKAAIFIMLTDLINYLPFLLECPCARDVRVVFHTVSSQRIIKAL